jgi:hypothetical protein
MLVPRWGDPRNPSLFETREHPVGTGKPDCSIGREFEESLASESGKLSEDLAGGYFGRRTENGVL